MILRKPIGLLKWKLFEKIIKNGINKTMVLRILLCIILFYGNFLDAQPLSCAVSAESAILMNADTGKILFEKHAYQSRYPASITKVAVGLYTVKFFSHLMDRPVRCSKESLRCLKEAEKSKENFSKYPSYVLETDMSHMGLKVDEEMSFRNLLLGTMIASADDASNVIAEVAGKGSIEHFMKGLNEYLKSLGLQNTKLMNPHGLHHPEHVSTAYDIALLTREGLRDPEYSKIVAMTRFERPKTNKQQAVTLNQTNKLIVKNHPQYYPYATGGKTGYHRRARYNLTATAEKDGRRLIAVVLSCEKRPNIFSDTKKLFQTAFQEEKKQRTLFPQGVQKFKREVPGGKNLVSSYTEKPLALSFYPSEEPELSCQLVWDIVTAPLKKGERIGELQLLADSVLAQTSVLYATEDVGMTISYFIKKKFEALFGSPILLIVLGGPLLFGLFVFNLPTYR